MHITVCKTCWRLRQERWKYGTSVLWMTGQMDCPHEGELKTKDSVPSGCPWKLEHDVLDQKLTRDHFKLFCLFIVAVPILLVCFSFTLFCCAVRKMSGWLERCQDKMETFLNEL